MNVASPPTRPSSIKSWPRGSESYVCVLLPPWRTFKSMSKFAPNDVVERVGNNLVVVVLFRTRSRTLHVKEVSDHYVPESSIRIVFNTLVSLNHRGRTTGCTTSVIKSCSSKAASRMNVGTLGKKLKSSNLVSGTDCIPIYDLSTYIRLRQLFFKNYIV